MGVDSRRYEDQYDRPAQSQRPSSLEQFGSNVVVENAQVFDQEKRRKGSEVYPSQFDGVSKHQTIWDAISKAGEAGPKVRI